MKGRLTAIESVGLSLDQSFLAPEERGAWDGLTHESEMRVSTCVEVWLGSGLGVAR